MNKNMKVTVIEHSRKTTICAPLHQSGRLVVEELDIVDMVDLGKMKGFSERQMTASSDHSLPGQFHPNSEAWWWEPGAVVMF